jgi:PadR family transcriptional regulator, regulatory protein AphA
MKTAGGATPNALLGLLSLRPMSGYDIRQMVSQSIGNFWSESYGQIYPGLKRLAAAGLVEREVERQKGRPDRIVYSLTPAGRKRLREWLKVPVARTVPRNELLLKMFFGVEVSPKVSREHVEAFLHVQKEAVKTYAAIAKSLRRHNAGEPQLPYWLMTLSYGQHSSAAMVKWCNETLKELDELERME